MIFGLNKRTRLGDGSPPVGSRGEVPVGGLGDEVLQKLTTFIGLKVYFYAKYINNFIF